MGITITSNYKGAIDLSGGYFMMHSIRKRVAIAMDKEFGEHYETLIRCYKDEDFKEFNKKANQMIKEKKLHVDHKDLLDFLFAPDCDGKISHKTCKKIYDLIKDIEEPKLCLRYAIDSDNDWEDFKTLLRECYSHRANMVWY